MAYTWQTEIRIRFEHHAILIELGEDCRHLPLAKRIVERVVNGLGQDIQALGLLAIDHHADLQAARLLIAGHIGQDGQGAEFVQ